MAGRSIRVTAARGTVINSAFAIGLNALLLVKNFLAAGLIATSAFGVWGVLTLAVGALTMLKDGLGSKFVQQDEEDQETAYQKAFTLELTANVALMGLMLLVLPLVALLVGNEDILAPGLVFVATMPAIALRSSTWIFYREMRYAKQRSLESIDPVVSLIVTVALAVAGFGYWSLVLGYFCGTWCSAIAAVIASPYRPKLHFDRATTRSYFDFAWPLLVANAGTMLIPSLLIIVGQRTLGFAGAGMMTLAGSIASYTDKVDQIITDTMYPAICRVRDRMDLLREAFEKSNRLDLMWGVPFGVGVALFASDLIEFGIGEKWRPGLILIQAFALCSAANHVGYNWTAFLRARGDTRPMAIAGPIVVGTFLVVTLPLLILYEMKGLAVGIAIMTLVSLLVRTYFVHRLFPGFSVLAQGARAVAPVAPAAAIVLVSRAVTGGDRTLAMALGELVAFGLVTTVLTVAIERSLLREMLDYLRGRGSSFAAAPAPAPAPASAVPAAPSSVA